ncbi:MAG: YkvA family protein [Pseudomonadota bacterium]
MKKVEIDEILMPGEAAWDEHDEARVRTDFWKKLKKTAARIPFSEDLVAAYYCALDPDSPTKVRATLFAALGYFILPLDSIPDFLIGFGLTDDIAVLTTAFTMVRSHITDAHRIAAKAFIDDESTAEPE